MDIQIPRASPTAKYAIEQAAKAPSKVPFSNLDNPSSYLVIPLHEEENKPQEKDYINLVKRTSRITTAVFIRKVFVNF